MLFLGVFVDGHGIARGCVTAISCAEPVPVTGGGTKVRAPISSLGLSAAVGALGWGGGFYRAYIATQSMGGN